MASKTLTTLEVLQAVYRHLLAVAEAYPEEEWHQDPMVYSEGDHGTRVYIFQALETAINQQRALA